MPSAARTYTVAEQVERIADVMRRGDWDPRSSAETIAADVGVSVSTVRNWSAEAWRIVKREVTNPAEVRENFAHLVTVNAGRASAERDYKAVAALVAVGAKLVGANAPERSEVTVKAEVDQYAGLPAEERLRIARDVVAEWSGEVARLEAELGVVNVLPEVTG